MRHFRRFLWPLGGAALVVALAAAAGFWWHHTSRPEYRLRHGQEALRRGDTDAAEHYALLLEANGAKDHARLLRGEAFFLQAKPHVEANPSAAAVSLRQALAEFNKIQDQGDLRIEAGVWTGQCLSCLKEPLQAEHAFLFVLDHRPDQLDAHRGLAAIYYDQGALSKAIPHLQEVSRLDERDGRPLRFLGHIYVHLDRDGDAAAAFQEALRRELSGEFVEDAREQLAACYVKRHAFAEALQVLDACEPARSQSAHVWAMRAQCLVQNQPAQAQQLLEQALTADPRSAELLALRGRWSLEEQDADLAAPFLEEALKIDPHDYAARYLLAQVYQALGRTAEADEQRRQGERTKELLQEVAELNEEANGNPWDARVRRRLAELCRELGRPEDADRWLTAARACGQGE